MIKTVPAYSGFEPFEISWPDFKDSWLPGLQKDGLLVGMNWSGSRLLGYDLKPAEALENIEAAIAAVSK